LLTKTPQLICENVAKNVENVVAENVVAENVAELEVDEDTCTITEESAEDYFFCKQHNEDDDYENIDVDNLEITPKERPNRVQKKYT
jgi:hypothetical protein